MTLLSDINVGGQQYGVAGTVPMGTCATPAGTEVKVCSFADNFELSAGNLISVTFTYANTYGDGSTTYPKLSINGTVYPVKYPAGGYANYGAWANGQAVTFMFDGTNLTIINPVTTTVQAGNNLPVSSGGVADAIGSLKAITYPAESTGRQMFCNMLDAGIFIDRDGFKITCLGSYGGNPVGSIYQMTGVRYLYSPDGVEVGRLVYNNDSPQGYELRIIACKLS